MNRHRLAAAALCVLGPPCAASSLAAELPPLIVTATRTAQSADATLASVTVITRAEMERRQSTSVPDLLRGVPGIAVVNSGGPGKATSLFLRGTESDHVLVLIDGIRVGSATSGTTAFQDIPIEQIERIEIVRGPRSSLYGSEAIGGVIQIFTRRGGGSPAPRLALGGGSLGTADLSAGLRADGARGWYSITASGLVTDGIDARSGADPDRDGYRNLSAGLSAGWSPGHGVMAELRWLQTRGENEYDGGHADEAEFRQRLLSGVLRLAPAARWNLSLNAGRSLDESDHFRDGVFRSRFDTRRDSISLQNDVTLPAGSLLTLGFDYLSDHVSGSTGYPVASRTNRGIFGQFQSRLGGQDLQISLRRDDSSQFGRHTTGAAAWGHDVGNGWRLAASYGTAFKAPTFNELYYPGYGNPDLRPESSRSLELGLVRATGGVHGSLNAYETRIDDLIAYDAAAGRPGNVARARIRGLEAVLSARLHAWLLDASLTLLDPEHRGHGPYRGNRLPRRAEQMLRVELGRAFGPYRLGAELFAEGRRYDDLANTRELGGYATLGLRAEYAFARAWRLQARVENLFDRHYETASGYNQPGRGIHLTLRYQP